MSGKAPGFRERLVFDETLGAIFDQTRRYILLRPDALMGIFRHLPEPQKSAAMEALEQSVFEQGSDSARAYLDLAGASAAGLPALIEAAAPQLGWGLWKFEVTLGMIGLEVRNSPFAAGHGFSPAPVCHAIKGMMRAVAGAIFDAPASVRELTCAAMGAQTCRFEAVARPHSQTS